MVKRRESKTSNACTSTISAKKFIRNDNILNGKSYILFEYQLIDSNSSLFYWQSSQTKWTQKKNGIYTPRNELSIQQQTLLAAVPVSFL